MLICMNDETKEMNAKASHTERLTAPVALASDFDNTLYFMNDTFREEDVAAIGALQKAGGCFGVCTGRSWLGITDVVRDRLALDFYILENGALILDGEQNILNASTMKKELADALLAEYVYPKGRLYVVHADKTVYGDPARFADGSGIEDIRDMDPTKVYQVSLATDSLEESAAVTAAINERYGDQVTAYQNTKYIDVIIKGCSKGTGLTYIKEHFGIGTMAAIGDSYNDLPMLTCADISFTLTPSPADLHEASDHVVDRVADAIEVLLGTKA